MQYIHYKRSSGQAIKLTQFGLLMAACLFFWFNPATHHHCQTIDKNIFALLNSSIQSSTVLQYVCGYLNHPHEAWLNVVVMACINIVGIYSMHPNRRIKAVADVLYFWAFFEVILIATHLIFIDLLFVQRVSPSILLPTVPLHELLDIPNLRIFSTNCFPAGHTLIAVYWANFSSRYAKAWVQKIIYALAILLILPRLFCGAHWLSDVIFTICYALFCITLADSYKLYTACTRYLHKTLQFIGFKHKATQHL